MRITLRARLTLIYGAVFLVAGVVLLGTTYALFDQRLQRTEVKIVGRLPPPSASAAPSVAPTNQMFVADDDGKVTSIPPGEAEQWLREQQERVQAAATTSLLTQGGIALAIVGLVAAAFGWLIAGRVLAPLRRVTETARRIARAPAADRVLHERIALAGPHDEVRDLAEAFDTMIGRLDRSFDGQRRFIANASHELRTPLTLSRALVELAMNRRTATTDVKQLGTDLLEINSRHERLITGLLVLATAENEVTDTRLVDLADVIGHVTAVTAAEAKRAGVTVLEDPGEAVTTGNALLIERVVHNLVENGIRHNHDKGWVRVTSRTRPDGWAELMVTNSGPEITPLQIPTLFEPFRRLSPGGLVSAKGAGLGLSIVRSVTRTHGGEATATPHPGGGLVVTVTLPPASEQVLQRL